MARIVIISGYFDPITTGHLEYIENAKKLGNKLFVIINNDNQAKKSDRKIKHEQERKKIVNSIKGVDMAIYSLDIDKTVNKSLEWIRLNYPDDELIFFNEILSKCPEEETCKKEKIELIYGK